MTTAFALAGASRPSFDRLRTNRFVERSNPQTRCGFQAIDEDKDVPAPSPYPSIEPLGPKGWRLRHGAVTNTFDKLYDLVQSTWGE